MSLTGLLSPLMRQPVFSRVILQQRKPGSAYSTSGATLAGMESIGIRELRQNASRYVREAKAGRRVAVTERGKLAAYLVPAEPPSSTLDQLEAVGEFRPAKGSILDHLPPPPAPPGTRPLSEVLAEMRDEER